MPYWQEILLILFSSFHSLYVLRNILPPLTFASLNRLILWNVAVHISKTNQRRLLLYLLKIQRTNGVSASGSNLLRSTLLWADSSEIRFIRFLRACEQGAIKLFFVAVVIVYADERAAEGEYLAKSDEDGVMYLPQWRAAESRDQQYPTKPAQTYC